MKHAIYCTCTQWNEHLLCVHYVKTRHNFDLDLQVLLESHFCVQPNLYVTYGLDKPPLQQHLVFKSLTSSVIVLGQEQQVIKENSPSMAGWYKQAIEQMCEQILHIKKRSKEGGLKTITLLTRFKGHLNIMCNVWTNINIAYSWFYNEMQMY